MINFLEIRRHFPQYQKKKSHWAYHYCRYVKDRPEIRKRITGSSEYAYRYCRFIKDRSEVRMYITANYYLERYREWKAKQ